MKLTVLILLTFLNSVFLSSQEKPPDSLSVEQSLILRFNILVRPGISLEKQLLEYSTIFIELYFSFTIDIDSRKMSSVDIGFGLEPRYYFSIEERRQRGKVTDEYSGSYVGFPLWIGFKYDQILIGPAYGFQNKIGSSGFWNIGLGYGFIQHFEIKEFGLIGYFKIGFTIL